MNPYKASNTHLFGPPRKTVVKVPMPIYQDFQF